MIKASEFLRTHGKKDVLLLHQMWSEGVSNGDIARAFGVHISTIAKWAVRYKLPHRPSLATPDFEVQSEAEENASLSGLALAPWVEERARIERELHYADRRGEREDAVRSLVWHRRQRETKA